MQPFFFQPFMQASAACTCCCLLWLSVGLQILQRLEADSGGYKLIRKEKRNYVGFIAEGPPDEDGGVDIAIVFRGTITNDEWAQVCARIELAWLKQQGWLQSATQLAPCVCTHTCWCTHTRWRGPIRLLALQHK
jgi:hypothetical protein